MQEKRYHHSLYGSGYIYLTGTLSSLSLHLPYFYELSTLDELKENGTRDNDKSMERS